MAEDTPDTPVIERLLTIEWDLDAADVAMGYPKDTHRHALSNGGTANDMVSMYLSGQMDRIPDGKSGHLFRGDELTVRLRMGTLNLNLGPSIGSGANRQFTPEKMRMELEKIDGWLIVFLCDLPKAPVYFINKAYGQQLVDDQLLTDEWKGKSRPVYDRIEAHFKELAAAPA